MTLHIHREIDRLKGKILSLGTIVENSVHLAVKAINKHDQELANKIITDDEEVNMMEIDIEEECLKILALHQPVAIDLRFIVAVLKINNDLERIGDLAVNIAERVFKLENQSNLDIPFDYEGMTIKVQAMLKKSLDSLVTLDTNLAREVCADDDEVDAIKSDAFKKAVEQMRINSDYVQDFTQMLVVAQQLERIADHATNIAEDVIYMVEGEIVRHRLES